MLDAANFVAIVEKRQGQMIGCLEEIAYNLGYIDRSALIKSHGRVAKSEYGQYLVHPINPATL